MAVNSDRQELAQQAQFLVKSRQTAMNPSTPQHLVVLTTFSDEAEMSQCISTILERRLAACVQQIVGRSSYRWEGKVQQDEEFVVLIKTTASREADLRKFLEETHSYDVPEIIALPILSGSTAYLDWLDTECSPA